MDIKKEILEKLEEDCRISAHSLALLLSKEESEIKKIIEELENDKVILGYNAVVDWDKTDKDNVTALIMLKVTPQRDGGFEKVAEKICAFDEVRTLYLLSGGSDLAVLIEGKTMREISYFVDKKISVLDSIVSVATHFVMRKYMEKGVVFTAEEPEDTRENQF
ncbi:AsnC family transcriptional regulator [Clostridia bacterium]|nr:AsnC family transcriptional regulator [Clostridia bacterium]